MQQADSSNIVSEVQYTNKNLKPKRVKDESQYFGEGKLENPKFPLGPTFTHLPNEEEKKRSKSNKIPQHLGERDLSLSGHNVNKDGPIAIEVHTKMDKHQKKKHEAEIGAKTYEKHSLHNRDISTKYIEQIIEKFKKHEYAAKETYKSVEKLYSSKRIERKAIKFYVEILVEKEDIRFIYVDVFAKKYPSSAKLYDDKKEVLLVKCDKNFKEHYIEEFVYDQLDEGNHKWGTKSLYETLFTYETMRHSKDLKSFVETILEIISRL